jgi:hypothetical protein
MIMFYFAGGFRMVSFARALMIGLVSLALPAFASSQAADFVYRIDGPASVSVLHVTGASAEWSRTTEDGAAIEAVPEKLPPIQNGAVHLVLAPGNASSTVELNAESGLASDWSGHGKLVFHLCNASEFMIPFTLTIRDAAGATFTANRLWMFRARNRFEIPLADIRTDDGTPLDLSRVRSLQLEIRSAEKFERDLWLYNLYIAGSGSPSRPRSELLLNFSPQGAPLLDGSRPIDERTAYAKWRGYGWTTAMDKANSAQFNQPKPDPMLSSMVWADLGSRKATLQVDLPDGEYRARFWGGNYTSKAVAARAFALAVNGAVVAERRADPATFYTAAEYFRGIDDWYEPGEDTWAKFGRNLYSHFDFRFTVRGGKAEFTWSRTLAAFGLLIAPATDFNAAIERVESARREAFEANLKLPQPATANQPPEPADQRRGFLLWSRDWQKTVRPYDAPEASERNPSALHAIAAQGQRVHSTITLTPLRSLGWVSASVSALRNPSGAVLPHSAVEVRAVKYLWDGWPASLDRYCLFPTSRAPAYLNLNQTWWFTITPPAGARPGVYTGTVRLLAQNGGAVSVPISIEVLPFQLANAKQLGASYSLWRNSDYNMGYALRYFMPAKMDYYRRLLRAEAADMKAHGMTAFHFTPPAITGVEGDHVTLDFSLVKEECRVVKEYGLYGPARPALVFLPIEISRKLMKETRYGDFQEPEEMTPMLPDSQRDEEFSDRFNRRFIDAVRQIKDFFDAQGIPIMLQTADEPRERNINQWNRNLAETIRYDKMIRAAIPRAKLYIDPEGDKDSGVDYLPLLDDLDLFSTHPWDQSAKMVERAHSGKPVLRFYNGIVNDRYDWGFEVAAANSTGFAQWHFGWELQPFQPFQATWHSGYTVAGPDGPLDSPGYEVAAAGIDDYRYIATLRARIAEAKKAGFSGPAVTQAEAALSQLQTGSEPYAMHSEYADERHSQVRNTIAGKTLDEWRTRLAGCIESIDRARSAAGR